MDADRRRRLEVVMGLAADGDRAAFTMIYTEFGPDLAGVVRRHLRRLGADGFDDVDGLVIDAADMLFRIAGGWRADGGALPWTWAEARIVRIVSAAVGQHGDSLDALGYESVDRESGDDAEDVRRLGSEPEPLDVLRGAAARRADVASYLVRLEGAARREADMSLYLEYEIQQSSGDPSPARTLAPRYGITPAALRKRVQRIRHRLAEVPDAA